MRTKGPAGHRYQRLKAVTFVDPHPLCDGTDGVRWIQVADIVAGKLSAPIERAVRIEMQETTIVYVPAFGIRNPPKQSLASHVHNRHTVAKVAHVLGQHVKAAARLDGPHQSPTFVQRHAGSHLTQHRLVGLQSIDGHYAVVLHRCGDDHGVEIVAFEHTKVVLGTPLAKAGRPRLARFGYHLSTTLEMRRLYVAHGGNLHLGDTQR